MCRKRVPDGRYSNWKTPSAQLSSGARNQHVAAFSRTEVCPTRDVRSRRTSYSRNSKLCNPLGGSSRLAGFKPHDSLLNSNTGIVYCGSEYCTNFQNYGYTLEIVASLPQAGRLSFQPAYTGRYFVYSSVTYHVFHRQVL